jgi:cell division control protein 24
LVKALKNAPEYSHMEDLLVGVAVTKRITDRVNEEQRRVENQATLKNLEGRVADWKGHHISNFGTLLLDDIFMVTKSEMDREYHVFLFEKIILCCKEYVPVGPNGKKVGKNNSLLKKQGVPTPLSIPGGPSASNKKKNTPLLLKGRIFLNNVTSTVPKIVAGMQIFDNGVFIFSRMLVQANILLQSTGREMMTWSTSLSAAETKSSFDYGKIN